MRVKERERERENNFRRKPRGYWMKYRKEELENFKQLLDKREREREREREKLKKRIIPSG